MRTTRLRNQLTILVAAFMLAGCMPREHESNSFQPAIDSGPTPWTRAPTVRPRGMQFAVVGDRTGFMVSGVFARAVDKINLLQPDFVMSIGDLVETWTENRVEMVEAWDELDALAARLDAPMFYTVGNHDIGNETSLDLWRERYGPSYYHFVYEDVLFISLDTEDPPHGIPAVYPDVVAAMELRKTDPEAAAAKFRAIRASMDNETVSTYEENISDAQAAHVLRVLEENPEVRWTFLFLHRPAWRAPEIHPNFLAIEEGLAGRDYTFFAGHTHKYAYDERHGRDYVRLSTTGGGRQGDDVTLDHIVWVTMTDDGPVIANVELDGVFDKTGKRQPLRPTE